MGGKASLGWNKCIAGQHTIGVMIADDSKEMRMNTFQALVADRSEECVSLHIRRIPLDELPEGDVTIRVAYSGINYKDGLACSPHGRVVKSYPMIPGIDLAGTVIASRTSQFSEGDEVIVTGYELGTSHYGGFSEYARVPAQWIVPLPRGLTMKEAMIWGTAGFTAALSIHRLEENGLKPEHGPVLVTGSTGGVGSTAVAMLAKKNYYVAASTGKNSEYDYLRLLGAGEILSREEVSAQNGGKLNKERWAGAVDPVGGKTLSYLLSTVKYGGSVALSGLAGGVELSSTVYPFILRGINLLGIDSVYCPMELRTRLWNRLGSDLKPTHLSHIMCQEITLNEIQRFLPDILAGKIRGRIVVTM